MVRRKKRHVPAAGPRGRGSLKTVSGSRLPGKSAFTRILPEARSLRLGADRKTTDLTTITMRAREMPHHDSGADDAVSGDVDVEAGRGLRAGGDRCSSAVRDTELTLSFAARHHASSKVPPGIMVMRWKRSRSGDEEYRQERS